VYKCITLIAIGKWILSLQYINRGDIKRVHLYSKSNKILMLLKVSVLTLSEIITFMNALDTHFMKTDVLQNYLKITIYL